MVNQPWLERGPEDLAVGWAIEHSLPEHARGRPRTNYVPAVQRTRDEVVQRLTAEINYWDTRHAELLDQESAGRTLKIRPDTAFRRARALEGRLEKRRNELTADEQLSVRPPIVAVQLWSFHEGCSSASGERDQPASTYARETRFVERRAVEAVMAAERALGRTPYEMPHNCPAMTSAPRQLTDRSSSIEVKGRVEGAPIHHQP